MTPTPDDATSPDPFVGRVLELAELHESLRQATHATGGVMLVTGEPGVGKSRLAEVFADSAARSGVEVLAGRCMHDTGAPPYWPWIEILRAYGRRRDPETLAAELGDGATDIAAVVPELGSRARVAPVPYPEGDGHAQFRFFEAVAWALTTTTDRSATLLVIEDLHDGDPSSLRLLRYLAHRIRSAPVMILATLRPWTSPAVDPLAPTLTELRRERCRQIDLAGLSVDETEELLHIITGRRPRPALTAKILQRTEGNPLFITETARAILARGNPDDIESAAVVPETLRRTIAHHLSGISAGARETLTLGALFGREFRIDYVTRAAEVSVQDVLAHLDEAVRSRVVEPSAQLPGCYRFVHALFGEVAGIELGEMRRVTLHARIADVLAAVADGGVASGEVAHHWFQAGPAGRPVAALEWTHRAARSALESFAYEEAVQWYRRAITALGWTGIENAALRAELYLGVGESAKRFGASEEAHEAFLIAIGLGRELGAPDVLTRAVLGSAPAVTWAQQAGPDPALVALLEEAIASWNGTDSPWHARALARLAVALFYGDVDQRMRCVSGALAMARRLGDSAALRAALTALLGTFGPTYDNAVRLERATELVALSDAVRDLEGLAVGRLWRCTHLMEHGRVAEFDAEHLRLSRVADAIRLPEWQWYARLLRGMRLLLAGRFEEAEAAILETRDVGQATIPFASYAWFVTQMAHLRVLQGREEYLVDYRAVFENFPEPVAAALIGWAASEAGDEETALAILERVATPQFLDRRDVLALIGSLHLAPTVARHADRERAAGLYAMLLPYASGWVQHGEGICLGPVGYAAGLLARVLGRPDDALRHLRHAVAEARRTQARPHLALALHELGDLMLAMEGPADDDCACDLIDEAGVIARTLGMRYLERRIDARERRLSTSAPSPARPAPPRRWRAVLRQEADYWWIQYEDHTLRIRRGRGMEYLAVLLRQPGQLLHVTELAGSGEGGQAGAGVVQESGVNVRRSIDDGTSAPVDREAIRSYQHRLREIEEESDQAERDNDLGRAASLRNEWERLQAEVVAAIGGRRSGTHGERARVAVTKAIGASIARIASACPALGAHLKATIKRGYFCAYVPDPRSPIVWEE